MPNRIASAPAATKSGHIRGGPLGRVATLTGVLAFVIFSVFPLYWMFVQALQPESERFAFPPKLIPQKISLDGFINAVTGHDVLLWIGNSIVVAGVSTVLVLLVAAWGAYAISRFQSRGITIASFLILATQMIPSVVLMIPLFKAFQSLGLVGGLEGLIVANLVFNLPIAVWMLKSVFDSVPIELEDAARVDGCNRLTLLFRITMPLALPGVLATGIFAFIEAWQEYLMTRVLISDPSKWVGSIGIASFFGEYGTPWNQVMATSLIFSIPPIVLFLLVQNRFVEGMAGGVKG